MKLALLLVLLPALATVSAQFNPSVTVTCALGPSYKFTITGQSASGVIFVDGRCEAQGTTASPAEYTFDSTKCSQGGGVPVLGTEFRVVVQEFSTLNLLTDLIVKVTCNLNLATVTKDANADVNAQGDDQTKTETLTPATLAASLKDASNSPLSSGNVGADVKLVISMSEAEHSAFDFQVDILRVFVTVADSVDVITGGCSGYKTVIPNPPAIVTATSLSSITLSFKLFIPKNTNTAPSLPSTGASAVTFRVFIKLCSNPCPAVNCPARKRRSLTANNSTYDPIEISNTVLVYPAGHKIPSSSSATNDALLDDVCISRTPIIGVLVALSVALVVCLALTAVMFCKLRKPARKGDMSPYDNGGYKA